MQAQQREVQRLLGRCLLRLQQYERLMKAVGAHSDISGPAHAMEKIRAARIDDASTKTLGTLMGQLFGSCVVTEGDDTAADAKVNEPEDVIHFAMRMQLSLSAEDYVRTQSELKELVLLRNNLVHHFIDQHDLWSMDGCLTAHDALVVAYERIDKHFDQLRGWGGVLSFNHAIGDKWLGFARMGWAEDGGSLLERSVSIGGGYTPGGLALLGLGSQLGFGLNWGWPNRALFGAKLNDQYAAEVYYRWHVADEIAITPSVQLLINPPLNPDKERVWVAGVRARLAF